MDLTEYFSEIYKLSFVTRYSTRPRIHSETVDQHSFFVAALLFKLHEKYQFNLGDAMIAAVSHDIAESQLGDILHPIRNYSSVLNEEIEKAEEEALRKFPAIISHGFMIFNSDTAEGLVTRLADAIQVQQYCATEYKLGNTDMQDIEQSSTERVLQLRKRMKDYERY